MGHKTNAQVYAENAAKAVQFQAEKCAGTLTEVMELLLDVPPQHRTAEHTTGFGELSVAVGKLRQIAGMPTAYNLDGTPATLGQEGRTVVPWYAQICGNRVPR